MATGSGIVAPSEYPIRRPTDPKLTNGKIVNGPRYPTGPGALMKEGQIGRAHV